MRTKNFTIINCSKRTLRAFAGEVLSLWERAENATLDDCYYDDCDVYGWEDSTYYYSAEISDRSMILTKTNKKTGGHKTVFVNANDYSTIIDDLFNI